jgi:phosphate transport system protein
MLRQRFEHKLHALRAEVVGLGRLVDRMLAVSVAALARQDIKWAKEFLANGSGSISQKCSAFEVETLSLIATQQPVASDLRTLIAVLEILAELDHIGKYAAGMAHNLERTADRVINICEWIIFAITGEMKELNVSVG